MRKKITESNILGSPASYLGIALLLYLCIRIVRVSISDDEAICFKKFVVLDWSAILSGGPDAEWTPNNHILNTLLMKLGYILFGQKDWALRFHLPFFFCLAYIYTYKLVKEISSSRWRQLMYLAILFLNHYLFDFFGLARGYAMCISLFIVSFYYLYRYNSEKSVKNIFLCLLTLFLATWANLSALLFIPLFYLIILFQNSAVRPFYLDLKRLSVLLGFPLVFSVILYFPLQKTLSSTILFGGRTGLFQDLVVTYINQYIHHNPYINRHAIINHNWKLIEGIGLQSIILYLALQLFSLKLNYNYKRHLTALCLILVFGILGIITAFFYLKGTPLPMARTVHVFSIAFFLSIILAFEKLVIRNRFYVVIPRMLTLFAVWHFLNCINTTNTIEWWQNGDGRKVSTFLKSYLRNSKTLVHLGVEAWQYDALEFYTSIDLKGSLLAHWSDLSNFSEYDMILTPKHLLHKVPKEFVVVKEFSKTKLFTRK